MTNQEAIEILQDHIDSYHYQMSKEGWERLVSSGIARPGINEKIAYFKNAKVQIEAYQLAINKLKEDL